MNEKTTTTNVEYPQTNPKRILSVSPAKIREESGPSNENLQ